MLCSSGGCGGSRYDEDWRKIFFGRDFLESRPDRVISLGEDEKDEEPAVLPTNAVKTSKYTPLNFFCINIKEQLQRFANVWFLILSALMWVGYNTELFPGLINPWPTLGTLLVMMAITAVSNALDDCARCHADSEMNDSSCKIVTMDGVEEKAWREVDVGDVVYLESGDQIPVDMVCIASASNEGLCFVSTANLDGETNLKAKSAVEETQAYLTKDTTNASAVFDLIRDLPGDSYIKAEPPCADIREFSGSFYFQGHEKGIDFENVLLRGTVLRNVPWSIGVAIYTGEQTRIMKNSQPTPLKSPTLDSNINMAVGIIIGIQLVMGAISMICREMHRHNFETFWYLQPARTMILPNWLGEWLAFFLLYSNLVPVSLFATIEACNLFQSKFIDADKKMYDKTTNLYAKARSRNLSQEPGQVDYIFSDKTGTLTQNIMDLKQLSIGGRIYGTVDNTKGFNGGKDLMKDREGSNKEVIDAFLECLGVAHTVIVDQNGNYEAESPDESALVEAVAELGYRLKDRNGHNMVVEVFNKDETYQVLCVNAFDSKRKRMSTLIKKASGDYELLIKGADNIMLDLAKGNHQDLIRDLHEFSCEGLRTLVFGRRKLSSADATRFIQSYEEAYKSEDRKTALDRVAEQMEQDIEILGATAIEDKLQDNVDVTIENIRRAGIKLWVLTGDKLETARNIGFSCKVLTTTMDILVLEDATEEKLNELLEEARTVREQIDSWEESGRVGRRPYSDVALMVTGKALTDVSADEDSDTLQDIFLEMAQLCSVVIACRVSPAQKAEMVRMVADKVKVPHRSRPITLAIGDGANDVPMIQEAKIGIGIYGKEGRQAVNNSDIAIAQFQYLQRLLFVHGHWNYIRAARVVMFTFWRNAALVLAMFYYTFFTGNTAIPLFEDMVRGSFNVVTFIPTLCTGIFERDQEADLVMRCPRLYKKGRENEMLNWKEVLETMFSAFVHSIILLMVIRFAYTGLDMVEIGDVWTYGTIVFTCLMLAVNYRLILITEAWNWIFWVGIFVGCVCPYVFFLICYCYILPTTDLMNALPMYMVADHMVRKPLFWLCLFTVPALAATVDLFKRFVTHTKWFIDKDMAKAIKVAQHELNELEFAEDDGGHSARRDQDDYFDESADIRTHSGYDFSHSGRLTHPRQLTRFEGRQYEPGSETDEKTPLSRSFRDASRSAYSNDDEDDEETIFGRIMQQEVPVCWNCMSRDVPTACGVTLNPWRCSCACTLLMAIFLTLSGYSIVAASAGLKQVRIVYDGKDAAEPAWETFWKDATANFLSADVVQDIPCPVRAWNESRTCEISVDIDEDMGGPDDPIVVYYSLKPFYQNFADYFQSVSWKELVGQNVLGNAKYEKACRAPQSRETPEGDRISPCGMQATAFFNDSFRIDGLDESDIAWTSDLKRLREPEDYPAPDNDTLWMYERFPSVINKSVGVQDAHFAVWMRPDAYAEVRKPYGKLYRTLKKGTKLNITIDARYPISNVGTGVRKELFLTTQSFLVGGKQSMFGWFQLFFAIVCLVISVCICTLEGIESQRFKEDDDLDEEATEEMSSTQASEY